MSDTFKKLQKERDEYKRAVGGDTSTAAHKILLVLDQLVGKASNFEENNKTPPRRCSVERIAPPRVDDGGLFQKPGRQISAAQITVFHLSD